MILRRWRNRVHPADFSARFNIVHEFHTAEWGRPQQGRLTKPSDGNYSADTLMRKLKLLPTGSDNDLSIL